MRSRLSLLLILLAPLTACDEPAGEPRFQGYVEGDYLLIGPTGGGRIVDLSVRAGDQVQAGDVLAELDPAEAVARRDQAAASLAQAKADLADMNEGKRPEEIAVIEAEIAEAEAGLAAAKREFERLERLRDQRVISDSALDQARMTRDTASARKQALNSELTVARLPARKGAITAAEERVAMAEAALAEAEKHLAERTVAAPKAGMVEEIYFRPGEVVAAGRPLASLLPSDHKKVRFFVPEALLASLRLGQTALIGCDGCPAGLEGRISFIATEAEYTPPVIFSVESRAKLVFKVEALPSGQAAGLRVGQPVDVRLGEAEG
jgi:HlyD family secretion protein